MSKARGLCTVLAVAFLLRGFPVPAAGIQDTVVGAPSAPSTNAPPATPPTCSVLDANAGKTGATPTLYLMCAASSMRIGEAATFVTSFNAATGATLVVRQQALSTDVDLLTADASGAIHLDELAGDIVDKLARAGLGRHRRLSVDAAAFATDGSVLVGAGDDGTQTLPTRLDLTPYVQATLATSATAIAPAPGPGQ